MFDEQKIKNFGRESDLEPVAPRFHWADMPVEALLKYRAEIDACLPPTRLRDVDVEAELVAQLRTAQRLQTKVLDYEDEQIPLNQIVQAVNSVSSVIEKLAKLQIDLAAAENLKKMEAAFIKAVQGMPTEVVEDFFERYGVEAENFGVEK